MLMNICMFISYKSLSDAGIKRWVLTRLISNLKKQFVLRLWVMERVIKQRRRHNVGHLLNIVVNLFIQMFPVSTNPP